MSRKHLEGGMREVNRSAIVLTPKQPFLEWLHSVDATSSDLTLTDLGQEPTIYLIGECESDQDFISQLREAQRAIFEDQLDGWWNDRAAWPRERTFDTFRRWFDFRLHSLVFDLCDEPLSAD